MYEEDCLFCKIAREEIPSKKVFENDTTLAFLDIRPMTEGHTIVIPKNHYETLADISDEDITNLFQSVRKVAQILYNKLEIDGYNIVMNNHEAAGQVIKHSHVHIIPRSKRDGLIKLEIPKKEASEEQLNDVLNQLKD
jgi:histidine triad (HIT) family protein